MYRNVVFFAHKIMKKQLQINIQGKSFRFIQCASFFRLVFISRSGLKKAIIDGFIISFVVLTIQCTEVYFFAHKIMKINELKEVFQERFSDLHSARAFFVWCSSRVSLSQRTDERRRPLQENKYTFGISLDTFCLFVCMKL